jgi:hypothetical protein
MLNYKMNRFTASATHLGISLVIFLVLGYLILYHWYPNIFFATDGGWQGIRIIAFVDLVLGPTLTLAVFKAGKPGLKMDLTLIGTLQAVCLIAGTYVVYSERPVAMVFADGIFHSVTVDDFMQETGSIPDLSLFSGPYPKWVSVTLPEDPAEQSSVRTEARKNGIPVRMLTNHYQSFKQTDIDYKRDAFPLSDIQAGDKKNGELRRFLAKYGGTAQDYTFIAFGTRYKRVLLGMRSGNGISGILELPTP